MIRLLFLACALFAFSGLASAQMTVDQKVSDFTQLAATYAKNYGPYEWKVQTQNFDLFKVKTWLDKVKASKDDFEFMVICADYVAALNDAHDLITFPSDFQAYLGFGVDLFDGVYLIESINTQQLRPTTYPFQVGDELVSVDGVAAAKWVQDNRRYGTSANTRSTARYTSQYLTFRPQSLIPDAVNLPDRASVVIKRQSGATETYSIPWAKSGTPVYAVGPVPGLNFNADKPVIGRTLRRQDVTDIPTDDPAPDIDVQYHAAPIRELSALRLPESKMPQAIKDVLGIEQVAPLFSYPTGFTQRLGRSGFDYFASGTITVNGSRIGYIRIPTFLPSSTTAALNSFVSEVTYMQANTDGLILDVMRNPGGDACYPEVMMQYLIPTRFRTIGYEIRATAYWLGLFSYYLDLDQSFGAPTWIIKTDQALLDGMKQAYSENRGRTGPIPICGYSLDVDPATDRTGKVTGYSKPIMVVTDEMSASAAEVFAAIFQDNKRGLVYGMRTMGAGGNVSQMTGTTFSEATITVTDSLMNRKSPVVTTDNPTAPYVENIGVRPDVQVDFMTKDNLINKGKTFATGLFNDMAKYIQTGKL